MCGKELHDRFLNESKDRQLEMMAEMGGKIFAIEAGIWYRVSLFTSEMSSDKRAELDIKNSEYDIKFKKDGSLILSYKNGKTKINKISQEFNLQESTKDQLEDYKKRAGRCHWGSIYLIGNLFKNKQKTTADYRVVTGMIYSISKKCPFLHTWLEYDSPKGEALVADYTMNAIMNRDFYYWLKKAEPIHEISDKTILQDKEMFRKHDFSIKEYLIDRDRYVRKFYNPIVPYVDNSCKVDRVLQRTSPNKKIKRDREMEMCI